MLYTARLLRASSATARSPANRQAGVTLAEMLVTVAIVGTLAVIASPSFRQAGRSLAVLAATHELMSALHTTRSAAIMRNAPGVVCLADNNAQCLSGGARRGTSFKAWLNTRGESPARPDADEPIVAIGELPSDIELRGSRASVTFWPVARAGTTNTITVCDRQGVAQPDAVVVSQSGRPRLAEGASVACR